MFQQIIRFFRRIFQNKRFRTAVKVIFWMLAGYFLFSYIYAVAFFMQNGMSFREAVSIIFWPFPRLFLSIALGIVIGVMGYRRGRKKNAESEPEDKPAEVPESAPAQEEEIIETKHYTFR